MILKVREMKYYLEINLLITPRDKYCGVGVKYEGSANRLVGGRFAKYAFIA